MTLWMWCLKWGKEVHGNLKLSGVFYTNFGGMFTCILDSIYLNIFTLENKKKFIASKELDTLNIRFTLMKHKQVCIWLVFSGKTSKEKIMRQTCHCARFVIVRSLKSCLTLWPRWLQLTRLPCPSLFPGVCSYSCPLSWWCHPTLSSSIIPFSSYLKSFPASESFPMSQLFSSGGQSIEASVSATVLPVNIQGWFPLGLTGLISLQSKGLSRAFSSTIVQKHLFFSTQASL